MIDVLHVDERTAIRTAVELIKALGEDHDLSKAWIIAVQKNFGLRYRSDTVSFMRSV